MILIDANVFMYAAGASHRCKTPSAELLDRVASGRVEAAVDAEALQEILHRYRAIGRWADGRRVYDLARSVIPLVIPIGADALDEARRLLDEAPGVMARDALHAAAARLAGAAICSWDRDFDRIPGVVRREPPEVKDERPASGAE